MQRKEYLKTGIELCKKMISLHNIPVITDHFEGRINAQKIENEWLSKFGNSFSFNNDIVKLIIPKNNFRFWVDFAMIYKGEFFPCNFKSGTGETIDNISGLKYIRYLIFYDLDKDYQLKEISEINLAKKIIELKKGKIKPNETNREYFCISHCINDGSVKIVPISCVRSQDIITNPKNLFQMNFHKASFDINRSLEDSVNFIIDKFIEYNKKRALSYLLFKEDRLV